MRNRRKILKGIGASVALGSTGVASASEDTVRVVKVKRPFNDPLSKGDIISSQKKELRGFSAGKPIALATTESRNEETELVGFVSAVDRDGRTRHYTATASPDSDIDEIHDKIDSYEMKFRGEL